MKRNAYVTSSEDETIQLGRDLAAGWPKSCIALLIGDLGAGKTTLAKGITAHYGAAREEDVSSPTFPLIHEYGDPPGVYHIDLYRLDTAEEVESLGLDEIFDRDAVVLLEWAERFPELLPARCIEVRITQIEDGKRSVEVADPYDAN